MLASAGAAEPLATAMLGADAGADELAVTRKIASLGKPALLLMLHKGNALGALVDKVWPAIEAIAAPEQAVTVAELHNKFMLDGRAFTLQLSGLDKFYGGLEGIVGPPNPQVASGGRGRGWGG